MKMNANEHEDDIEMASKVLEMTAINKKINDCYIMAIGYIQVFRISPRICLIRYCHSPYLSHAEYHSNQT